MYLILSVKYIAGSSTGTRSKTVQTRKVWVSVAPLPQKAVSPLPYALLKSFRRILENDESMLKRHLIVNIRKLYASIGMSGLTPSKEYRSPLHRF